MTAETSWIDAVLGVMRTATLMRFPYAGAFSRSVVTGLLLLDPLAVATTTLGVVCGSTYNFYYTRKSEIVKLSRRVCREFPYTSFRADLTTSPVWRQAS
jgi:hypothetical protein